MVAPKRDRGADPPAVCRRERTAVEFLESVRGWRNAASCPHCHGRDVYQMRNRSRAMRNRRYLWRCRSCDGQFTIRLNTLFEDSRIPLHHWCYAVWAACALPRGLSAGDLCEHTGITYTSALFMIHRMRLLLPTATTSRSRRSASPRSTDSDRVSIKKNWKRAVALALRAEKPSNGWTGAG